MLHSGEGEGQEAGRPDRLRGPKAFLLPPLQKDASSQGLQLKRDKNVLLGIWPAQLINTLIRKTQKLFNSLRAQSLKTKRGSSNAQSSSGLQKGPIPANTAASVIKKA